MVIPEVEEASAVRILLVDDDYDTARALGRWLEYNHYKVDLFTDPRMALSRFSANSYRLTVIDHKMHCLSGFELYERLIAIDPALKVCFVTAYNMSGLDEFKQKHKLTADCFVKKPVDSDILLAAVRKLFEPPQGQND